MRETLGPMAIPALAAHLTDVKFMYSDNKYYELCGQMGHLIGPSGIGKAQLARIQSRPNHDRKRVNELTVFYRKRGRFTKVLLLFLFISTIIQKTFVLLHNKSK